jgi:transposase
MLIRYALHNEKTVWRVVRVPSQAEEDERRPQREYKRLKNESTAHRNRIRSLLVLHGRYNMKVGGLDYSQMRDWQGQELPASVREELIREQARLAQLNEQLQALERQLKQELKDPKTAGEQKASKLARLKGIGVHGATLLSHELFGWRTFHNRREVGAIAGLTGTAYASGELNLEQGISKAGNKRVRCTMIEMAWMWTRYQPKSQLTQWFWQRFGWGGKRMRRIGIVALARKLLIALWRYVEFDEIPAGAVLSAA